MRPQVEAGQTAMISLVLYFIGMIVVSILAFYLVGYSLAHAAIISLFIVVLSLILTIVTHK